MLKANSTTSYPSNHCEVQNIVTCFLFLFGNNFLKQSIRKLFVPHQSYLLGSFKTVGQKSQGFLNYKRWICQIIAIQKELMKKIVVSE